MLMIDRPHAIVNLGIGMPEVAFTSLHRHAVYDLAPVESKCDMANDCEAGGQVTTCMGILSL